MLDTGVCGQASERKEAVDLDAWLQPACLTFRLLRRAQEEWGEAWDLGVC